MKTQRLNNPKPGYIYLIKDNIRGPIKIGFTQNLDGRYAQLRLSNAGLGLEFSFHGTTDDEVDLHFMFRDLHIGSEWFVLSEVDVQNIIKKYTYRNNGKPMPAHKAPQPDKERIKRLLKPRPALRSRYLAEAETIEHHRL